MTPEQKRFERSMTNAYRWLPVTTPAIELFFRVQTGWECGANTEFMARLWGWSEPTIERALHIVLERKILAEKETA